MLLYRCIFPENNAYAQSLYFVADGDVLIQRGVLVQQPGSMVRFDTYFNSFFYTKYTDYTGIEQLTVKIHTLGRLDAELVCVNLDLKEMVLEHRTLEDGETTFAPVRINELPYNGTIFCRFKAISESRILDIRYETDIEATTPVRVAAVICTYRREEYVKRNLVRISRSILHKHSPIFGELNIFVIDNGNTLKPFENDHIRIISNRNLGGSGGFTRGMLEALGQGGKYSHVLLMDDDISFEPEIFVKTIQLLKILPQSDKPLIIGGQMLLEDDPTIQYEAGGRFKKGRLWAYGRGFDLSTLEDLLKNQQEHQIDYNAWWYCCIPINLIRSKGLPLPFFIKGDDVDYGLRSGADFLLINGIGVWHQSFARKQSPHLEYYIKRNELIVSAIHKINDGIVPSLFKLFKALGGSLLRDQSGRILYLRRAYADFLKGPDFLLKTDGEKLNEELINSRNGKPMTGIVAVFKSVEIFLEMLIRFLFCYGRVRDEYRSGQQAITSECAWRQRLGLRNDGGQQ